MCGRYTLTNPDPKRLKLRFGIDGAFEFDERPRFNIAPSQAVAVVTNSPERKLEIFQWGLIPSWAKDPKIGNKLINARAESLAEKPSFRTALKRRRFVIYPGKVSQAPTFRVGTIGHVFPDDFRRLVRAFGEAAAELGLSLQPISG